MLVLPWTWVMLIVTYNLANNITVVPVYFQTEQACRATAEIFNGGPNEPSPENPKKGTFTAFGAFCRPTGAQ